MSDLVKNLSSELRRQIEEFSPGLEVQDVGTVLEAGDGIARVSGLADVRSQELVQFSNGVRGIAFNLENDAVGVIIMGEYSGIEEGMRVHSTGRIASVPVGDALIGRVVNALGEPVDGKGPIASESYRPLINTDLETARARLIEDVAGYARFSGTSATVVFDASKRKGAARGASEILGVTVVFTKEGETADEAIERLAHQWRDRRRVTVATSDYAQQQAVFAEGVLRMSARELIGRIEEERHEAASLRQGGKRRVFLEDRIDAEVREALRRLARGE